MMASKISPINFLSCAQLFTAFVLIYPARLLHGYTNPADGKDELTHSSTSYFLVLVG